MNADEFWVIIDDSRKQAQDDPERHMEVLIDELAKRSESEIVDFGRLFHEYWVRAYTWPLWGAAFLIGEGCSDDGFMDFRGWLISRGRTVYERALANPDTLATVVARGEDGQVEGFHCVASQAWEKCTGRDSAGFPEPTVSHPKEPVGSRWEEEDLKRLFPDLSKVLR